MLPNDDDLTYCLIELDAGSLEFLLENVDKFEDPMARTLCWSTAWEMTRAGSMRARDFVALVARGAAAETELAVLERILSQAAMAQSTYADPEWAKEATRLADALLEGARSDDTARSIVFTQALAGIKLHDASRTFFQELLKTSSDAGLRWKALTALIADGSLADVTGPEAAGAAMTAVAEELNRDNTATGYQASLKALAAVNTEDNKRAVWDEIVAGELGNRDLESKLAGLTFVGSDELLPSAEFFDVAEKIWSAQSNEIALTTVTGLFPRWDVSQETLDRADEFLSRDLAGGLRRAVTEQRDRLARALRNRAVDRG